MVSRLDLFTQRETGLVDAVVNRSYLITQVLDLFTQRAVGLVDAAVNRSYLITQVLDLFTQRAVGLVDAVVNHSYLITQVLDVFAQIADAPVQFFGGGTRLRGGTIGHGKLLEDGGLEGNMATQGQ